MRAGSIGLFAMVLACAGVPLYLHLPRYVTADLGLSLTTLSIILVGLRCLDFLQDPLLGRVVDRLPGHKTILATGSLIGMAAGFVWLFAAQGNPAPLLPLIAALVLLFTCYSLASILFYGQTAALAGDTDGIFGVAMLREMGMLAGIILAAIGPLALGGDYATYGWVLAGAAIGAAALTRSLWSTTAVVQKPVDWQALRGSGALSLIALALVNSLPVAITSTLFLFYVEDWLRLPDMAGPLLVLFFLSAGASVPVWTWAARRVGSRAAILAGMALAIGAFIGAAILPPGAAIAFAVICAASGAALGADMVLLPALFSALLERAELQAGQAFGLWNFALKLALALAAILLLPALDLAGFAPAQTNTPQALRALVIAYAVVPCGLKLGALVYAARLPNKVFVL